MQLIILILLAYLLGSVPFAMIIAKGHGINIREIGSGNVGATNLSRACGRKWGYICFLLDVCKGFVPVFAARFFITLPAEITQLWLWLAVGCAAILGHVFPIYLRFKGGKGVATSLGVVLGLHPYFTLPGFIAFVLWCACVLIWRYISLASIVSAIAFPVCLVGMIVVNSQWEFSQLWPLLVVAVLMPLLVIYRHRGNVRRLLNGTENKVFGHRE